ncbi:transposase [Burkholderia diffusa]|nr:transposase [Burkholderia diffusa]
MATEEVRTSGKRYTDEFKIEAVKQVTERGHSVADVAPRLGITTHSLYAWKLKFGRPDVVRRAELDQSAEVRRLKAELKRMTEERDILKKAAARSTGHRNTFWSNVAPGGKVGE